MLIRRLACLFLLLVLGIAAAAQVPGATITLRVRLWYDNGHKVEQRLRVELLDSSGNYVTSAFADNQGQVDFLNLSPGSYQLRVTGPDVEESTSQRFTLSRSEGQHYENVDVRTKHEADGSAVPTAGGTVATVDLNVPDKAKKEFERGVTALQSNDLATARKAFEKALQIYPRYAGAYNNLGVVAMKAGDRDAATAAFQQAIHINSHYSRAYINLVRILLPDRKYSEAESMLDLALVTEPLNAEALTLLANVQLQIGKYAEAAATATKVHSVPHEGFAIVHIVAAVADENRHMPEEAAAQYAAYLKEAPDGPAAPRARQALAALQQMKGP